MAQDNDTEKERKILLDDKRINPYKLYLYPNDSIALLELNTFDLSDIDIQITSVKKVSLKSSLYRNAIEKLMDSVISRNIKHLFIDITANSGGSSFLAFEILNYLQSAPTQKTFNAYSDIKISEASREMFKIPMSFFDYVKIPFNKTNRKLYFGKRGQFVHEESYWKRRKRNKLYSQNAYLLQSQITGSASMDLASFFKYAKIGTIIGGETCSTDNYINSWPFQLPNSKLYFVCAVQYSVNAGSKEDGRGVLPDIGYEIEDPTQSFTLEQLKEMLQLVEKQQVKK